MRIGPADLDEIARQLRLLNKENIQTEQIIVNGITIDLEMYEEGDQMGPSKRYYITDMEGPEHGGR